MYRAIVVDDEEMIRNGMSRQIETMGLSIKVVAKAKDGVEALEHFHTYTPDILLMDINLPRIDGLECIRRIREMNQICVIIIVSGYDEFEYARQAIKHNVDFYMLKPVEDDEFKTVIQQAIAKYNNRIEQQNIISRFTEQKPKPRSTVIEFINTHYTQKELSSEILEKEFNLSRTALFKLMKELTGMSFVEYLTMLRINYSIRLLKEDKTIGEISNLSGYADQYYFSRVFKKKTGFTPTEYRENMERER
ncbi:response regulator transcription factor [Anaerocolumna sp.]|uniref:response regulator transcription factor n=1 Tax=Anaerocolumna sp. TaxID=2041569 RepID=UPI0028A88F4A|nr:response regulator [Anaerocolumna sp.]